MMDTEKETTTRTMEKSKEAEAQMEELIEGGTKRIAQVVCSMLSQGIPMKQIEQRTGLSYSVLEAAVYEVDPGVWNYYFWQREKTIAERVTELAAAEDKGRAKGKTERRAEGRAEEKENVARTMLSLGYTIEQIHQCTKLSVSEIEALQK